MGFKAKITKSGMTGELYFVITQKNNLQLQGVSEVRLRSFESKGKLDEALSVNNEGENGESMIQFVTDEVFLIPLDENKDLTTEGAYRWIRVNHYQDATDL